MVPSPRHDTQDTRRSLQLAGVPVGVMWVLELIDTLTFHSLDRLGLQSWDLDGLWGMFTAPWLHLGWQHLMNNSLPLLVLGFLVAMSGIRRWLLTTLVVVLTSGLAAWLLSPPGTMTMGASGVVFGWLTYLLARAWWSRDWRQVLIGVVVFVVYGSVLWGVLPADQAVSWQGHLGGAAGGILAARMLHGRRAS